MPYFILKSQYPKDIISFLDSVFEIVEIRGRVGYSNGITFVIRTDEKKHHIPHVHAAYGKYNISIEIETGKVLAGNLPSKNQRLAVEWVVANKVRLLNDWKNTAISATSTMTTSMIGWK